MAGSNPLSRSHSLAAANSVSFPCARASYSFQYISAPSDFAAEFSDIWKGHSPPRKSRAFSASRARDSNRCHSGMRWSCWDSLLPTPSPSRVVSSIPCLLPAAHTAIPWSQNLRKQLHQVTEESQGREVRMPVLLVLLRPTLPLHQTSKASTCKGNWIQHLPRILSFSFLTTNFPPVMQEWGTTSSQPARHSPPAATTTVTAPWWPPKPSCIRFLPLDWSPVRTYWAQTLSW